MTETPNLEDLKGLSTRLSLLLENPQPGLFTWGAALKDALARIAIYADQIARTDFAREYVLTDFESEALESELALIALGVVVRAEGGRITIHPDGYGCAGGDGPPITIGLWNGEVEVVLQPDITKDENLTIPMGKADGRFRRDN